MTADSVLAGLPGDQAAGPSPVGATVSVGSKLMQNYRLSAPVAAGTDYALAPTDSGEVEVFSIGTDGHLYNIYPDSGSDTNWSLADMQFPGGAAVAVSAVHEPATGTTVYA